MQKYRHARVIYIHAPTENWVKSICERVLDLGTWDGFLGTKAVVHVMNEKTDSLCSLCFKYCVLAFDGLCGIFVLPDFTQGDLQCPAPYLFLSPWLVWEGSLFMEGSVKGRIL